MSEQDKTPAEMAVERGEPVKIERAANGFIVTPAYGMRDPMVRNEPRVLVFNDLAGRDSLLDWLASHFESDADRGVRLLQQQIEASVQHEQAVARFSADVGAALVGGFPPITTDAGRPR